MKMFVASLRDTTVKEVDVVKISDTMIRNETGHLIGMTTTYFAYRYTYADAKAWLVRHCQMEKQYATDALARTTRNLEKAEGL